MFSPLEVSKCRTCLQECSGYHHLEENAENNIKIIEMLDEIVPQIHIRTPSQFSHMICGICVDKLLNGYKFQQLCIDSNKRLCSVLENYERPAEIESDLENAFDPLMGENNFKMKQELSDNVTFEIEIIREEFVGNLISNDACASDIGAEVRDTDSRFAINDHLRRHMRTHTGEKPYKCNYCESAYAESGDLTKHLRTHVGENTYMCDQCPLAFKYIAELRQHVSDHFRMAHMQKMSEASQ